MGGQEGGWGDRREGWGVRVSVVSLSSFGSCHTFSSCSCLRRCSILDRALLRLDSWSS